MKYTVEIPEEGIPIEVFYAAPEMLAMLKKVLFEVKSFEQRTGVTQFSSWIRESQEVIAKAR